MALWPVQRLFAERLEQCILCIRVIHDAATLVAKVVRQIEQVACAHGDWHEDFLRAFVGSQSR